MDTSAQSIPFLLASRPTMLHVCACLRLTLTSSSESRLCRQVIIISLTETGRKPAVPDFILLKLSERITGRLSPGYRITDSPSAAYRSVGTLRLLASNEYEVGGRRKRRRDSHSWDRPSQCESWSPLPLTSAYSFVLTRPFDVTYV